MQCKVFTLLLQTAHTTAPTSGAETYPQTSAAEEPETPQPPTRVHRQEEVELFVS